MNFRTFVPALLALAATLLMPHAGRAQQPVGPVVRSIEVQYAGPATISREKILANMRTQVGRPYSELAVEEDIRTLYATGNVSNVRIFGEPQPDGVKVTVVIAATSQITDVLIEGITRFKPSRVRKEIATKPGEALNDSTIDADRRKILDYYRSRGFTDADVRSNVENNEKTGTARVVFTVSEGGKMTIRAVRFEGNASIKDRELARVVRSKPRTWLNFFTKAGRVDSDQLNEDATALREYYQNKGYIYAQVQAPRVERFEGKVDLVFAIVEGPQYRVGKVTFSGGNVFPPEEFARVTKLKSGAIYSPSGVTGDRKAISDLYGSRGYVELGVTPQTNPGTDQTIDVAYLIEEGSQSYIERVNISIVNPAGRRRTKDKVVRREVAVAPGEVLNTVRMDASRQRLQNLNYFSKVDVAVGETGVAGRKDVNIYAEEKRTGSFNFGAGFSSIDNLLGFAEITQGNFDITNWPNFTGGGQKFRLRAQVGTRRKDFVLSLTEPYFLDLKLAVGGELFYREASFVSDVYSEQRYGIDLNARKALNEFTFVRFGYRLENIGIKDVDEGASQAIRDEEGERLKSQVSSGITYDTRDSVFLTRKGERVDFSAYVAGGFLGGDTDIYGFDLEGSKYFSLPYDTILTVNGELAVVNTWANGDRVPIFDRLYLGGPNNLRGYRFRDVGPKDEDGEPIGGNTLARATIEYTFPVVEKIRGAVFYDVGFVSSGSYEFTAKKGANGSGGLNQDVGIGVRLDLPIGPVRIDYGIPLQADRFNDSGGKFNFNIGYQF